MIRSPIFASALAAALIICSPSIAFAKGKEGEESQKYVDHATVQFLGLALEKPIVVEGAGRDIHQARLDALRKLGKAREGKLAKVQLVVTNRPPMNEPQWHYWWHNAEDKPHWKPCGSITPTLPRSPFGLKLFVTEKDNTCKIEINSEPTLADLFWDVAGQKSDPNRVHPGGLAKGK